MHKRNRREFLEDSLLAAAVALPVPLVQPSDDAQRRRPRRDPLRVAVLGVRGRGRGHVGAYKKSPDAEVAVICDPDEGVIELAMQAAPDARYVKDLRAVMEDDTIDAVSIATPNHWHALAAVWALDAGKHVYVEKPVSHDVIEGRKVVEAARRSGRVCQHGTQARSMKATHDAITWLREGGLGRVQVARALCYKRRETIGKVDGPQVPPETLDYDLWTGPARLEPLRRKEVHYDWHWVFNTGNGDIGNQGVHQMDIARWGLAWAELPDNVRSVGGRFGYDDDGNTPNTQVALFERGDQQLIFEVRGLNTRGYRDTGIGVVFHCEHGYLVSASYGKVVAFDHDGKPIKTFTGGGDHFQNFVDAALANDASVLTAEIAEGHLSSALCHMANVSHQLGEARPLADAETPFGDCEPGNESFRRFRDHLVQNGVDAGSTDYTLGPRLSFDAQGEQFEGEHADAANALAWRPGRGPFTFPQVS